MVVLILMDMFYLNIEFTTDIIFRLFIACLLGGFIGFEREHYNRKPAGFRTHMLVCAGSALVMLISEFIFERFGDMVNIDPARLGAQVISGIGFLGAGTIIRHGVNIKGLTTAASLWTTACIGLACGVGFYSAAIIATMTIYFILIIFKKLEVKITNEKATYRLELSLEKGSSAFDNINGYLLDFKIEIIDVSINLNKDNLQDSYSLHFKTNKALEIIELSQKIKSEDSVLSVLLERQ